MIGKILGNYRILKKLGEGGMGAVYLARDLSLEREVALKVISPELARNPGLMARFRVEAIAQAKLNHTNIVTIHSFDQEKDIYYIVMEHMDGKTLKAVIKEKDKMPVLEALKIFSQLLEGIVYAHSRGVVHRDIKPSNIFLASPQIAKIGDFGIAKVEGIEGLTKVGTTLGSPVYSSPEQLLGKKTDARTDIYSLGITLYEMLTGAPPLRLGGKVGYEAIKQTLDFKPQKPSAVNPAIPGPVDALVLKSIAKEPGNRFQTAVDFEKAVKQLISSMDPTLTPAPDKPVEKRKITAKKMKLPGKSRLNIQPNRKQLVLALSLGIIVVGLILFLILSAKSGPIPPPSSPGNKNQVIQPVTSGKTGADMPRIIKPVPEDPGITPSEPVTTNGFPQVPTGGNAAETLKKMDWHINKGNYRKAVNIGLDAVKNGTVSGEIYLKIAQAYYYDKERGHARTYYLKALNLDNHIGFSVDYRYKKNRTARGTLVITWKDISFQPAREKLSRYAFSVPMSRVKKVYEDIASDIRGLFRKKQNRKSLLIIRVENKERYVVQLRNTEKKFRGFVKYIIDNLRGDSE